MWSLRYIRRKVVNLEKIKGAWNEAFPQEKDIGMKFEIVKKQAL